MHMDFFQLKGLKGLKGLNSMNPGLASDGKNLTANLARKRAGTTLGFTESVRVHRKS